MDVDKKPEEAAAANGTADAAAPTDAAAPVKVEDTLKGIVSLLEKSVKAKDTRLLMGRLLRQTAAVHKQLTPAAIRAFLGQCLPADSESKAFLAAQLEVRAAYVVCARGASLCRRECAQGGGDVQLQGRRRRTAGLEPTSGYRLVRLYAGAQRHGNGGRSTAGSGVRGGDGHPGGGDVCIPHHAHAPDGRQEVRRGASGGGRVCVRACACPRTCACASTVCLGVG